MSTKSQDRVMPDFGIGKAIQWVRRARDLSATDVAKNASISNPFLSLIEQGERQPSLEVVHRIASALSVPAESLILLATPKRGSLRSTNRAANGLVNAVRRLARAESQLRHALEMEFCTDAST